MPRHFNTGGPCRADIHYMLPPERRIPKVRAIVEAEDYFVLHAPRQVGKTTALMALARTLTEEGRFASVLVSMEVGAAFPADVGAAEDAILGSWTQSAQHGLPAELRPPPWPAAPQGGRIAAALAAWAGACVRPIALFVDEIDALRDEVHRSVLRQIRDGHKLRPHTFPASLALVGLRDVRDYKVASGGSDRLNTASPFNVKVDSLTMGDFTQDDVAELYAQHTADTGQVFEPEAVARAYELTRGQPWLVNALARQATGELVPDRARPITRATIDAARDALIRRQDTHLDSLAERLQESRVRAVIEPILAGRMTELVPPDDLRFCVDLGLVRIPSTGGVEVANPIYAEVLPRVLAQGPRATLPYTAPVWLRANGTLDAEALLGAFLAFWRQHGEPLLRSAPYHEIAPHLVLLAFLDRVANGGGRIEREYAIGSGRMDVLLDYGAPAGRTRVAMELKVWRDGRKDPLAEGLVQLEAYLTGLGLDEGWLVLFDQRSGQPPIEDRVTLGEATTASGRRVRVVRG